MSRPKAQKYRRGNVSPGYSQNRKEWGKRNLAKAVGAPKTRTGAVKPRGELLTGKELADTYTRSYDP